jgi:LPS-assembly lipoprotein
MTMHTRNRRQTGVRGALQAWLAWALLLGLLSAISGCGFHPRGSSALPSGMALTFIKSAQPYGSLVDDFSAALQAHGGHLTRQRSEATAILHIVSNDIEKRVLSVDTAGKVLEYEIQQTIRFSVETSEKLPLVEVQEVSLARDYIFSSAEALSTEREDKIIRTTLQRNLVNLAMLRITAAAQ